MKGAGGIRKGNGEKVEGQSKRGIAGTGWREGGKAGNREGGKAGSGFSANGQRSQGAASSRGSSDDARSLNISEMDSRRKENKT